MNNERKHVPKIRFPSFVEPWEQRKLGELYSERNEKGNDSLQILSVSIHTGVSDSELDSERLGKNVRRSEDKTKYKHVYRGDLIFNMMRAWQGAIGVAKNEGMISPAYISAIPNKDVFPLFMDYSLRRKESISQINDLSYGVTDFRKRLYWGSFIQVNCALPSIEEQRKIWTFLNAIDNAITLHQRKCDELKVYKKGLLQQMFPQPGELVPRLRFPGFTDPWEQRKLKDIFIFKYGDGNSNPSNGGPYPVFGAGGIQGGYTEFNAENSVIIGHMGDAGCVSWGEGKHFVTYNGTITKPKDDVFSSKFGYYLLSKMNLRKYRGGSGLPFLTYDMLNDMDTVIPPDKSECEKISECFSVLDTLITLHQRKCDELKVYKNGLLQMIFV